MKGFQCLGSLWALYSQAMNTDPWRFLLLFLPMAWFLSTRYRNWELSMIAAVVVSAIVVLLIRKHPMRMAVYGFAWLFLYYVFVGFDPITWTEDYPDYSTGIYAEVIAVNGSHRYKRTASFLQNAGIPYHVEFNGPLESVPWEDVCQVYKKSKNNAKYTEFTRLHLLELAEKHQDKEWLFMMEDDAEPVHSLSTFLRRFNYALVAKTDYDMVWLDYRNVLSGGWLSLPYGGITGILYRVSSLRAIAKTLEFRPEYCNIGTGIDEIWSVMCMVGTLKCDVLPILRENGQKTSLFVGLRPLDSLST